MDANIRSASGEIAFAMRGELMTKGNHFTAGIMILLLGLASIPPVLFGQTTTASISGEVRDASGAVISAAALTITNVETGLVRTTASDATGRYRVQNLAVGSYQVEATFSGFKSVTRRGITLTVGQAAVVDVLMEVGAVTERVEVTAEAPLVDTSTAVLGGLVSQQAIQDLPLNGRSFLELATLQAGTISALTGQRSESQGFGQKISISGGRYTSNVFLIDGTVMNDAYNSAGGSADGVAAGVESVREFKVITNSYSAEYGQHTGGVINAVTRGGTNDLHGSVYEFLRNDNLDSFRWEDKARNTGEDVKPEFRRNQYGFALGGPIRRDQTFFFGNYEALREAVGSTQTISIPDERMRQGFLPSVSTRANDSGEIDVAARNPAAFARVKPFFDKFWPIPSGAVLDRQGDGTMDYTRFSNEPTKLNYFTGRVDHKLSDNDSIFGRYTIDHSTRESVESINVIANQRTRSQFATLQYDKIISPTVLNSANAGYTRAFTASIGVTYPGYERVSLTDSELGHASVGVSGIDGTGSGATDPRIFILNNYQAKDDLTINRGNHTFKIGANLSRLQHNDNSPRQPAGQFTFQSLEDFLMAEPEEALISLATNYVRYTRQTIFGAYFQDDWRLRRGFTLNWGVRYEMTTAPKFHGELAGHMPRALEDKFFTLNASGQNVYGPSDIELSDTLFENPSKDNFAPRVGFAWDVLGDGKTSIRGGAGIFHENLVYWTYRLGILHTTPLFTEGRLVDGNLGDGTAAVDFPNAFFTQLATESAPRYESFQAKPNQPYVGKFSLEIQRQVTPTTMIQIGYSGTRGVHLPNRAEQNGRRWSYLQDGRLIYNQASAVTANSNFGRTRHRRTSGTSSYHSLRLEAEKRLSHGLQLKGNYTWSKNIDDGTSVTGSTDFTNDPNPRHWSINEKGLAATDVRHVFTMNSTYALPGANLTGWTGQMLGGWQVNGLLRISAGLPMSAQTGFDYARQIEGGRFLDQPTGASNNPIEGASGGCTLQTTSPFRFGGTNALPAGAELGTPDLYYDPCVFLLPQPRGVIGTMGRNTIIGPGSANLDFSVAKTFNLSTLHENTRLEFRGELFNALNHPNFSQPGTGVFAAASQNTGRPTGTAGIINGTSGNPRKIQFGLKLTF